MSLLRFLPVGLVLLAACGSPEVGLTHPEEPTPDTSLSDADQQQLLGLLKDYPKAFGCVDDELRWAPTLCRRPPNRAKVRMSAAPGEKAHARKLYWLFAQDRVAYAGIKTKQDQPVGQVLVKQAWVPQEGAATDDTPGPYGTEADRSVVRSVEQDGAQWHVGAKHALFVMWKRGKDVAGTDEGWTYATVTPDGSRVTASGRIQSCMQCHRDATHDRLFGLP